MAEDANAMLKNLDASSTWTEYTRSVQLLGLILVKRTLDQRRNRMRTGRYKCRQYFQSRTETDALCTKQPILVAHGMHIGAYANPITKPNV